MKYVLLLLGLSGGAVLSGCDEDEVEDVIEEFDN